MTRINRVNTTVAQELLDAEADDNNREYEFEESDDELDAIELTPEDLYEDIDPMDDEEYENTVETGEVAEKAIAKSELVYVIYRGLKSGERAIVPITVIIPYGPTKTNDPKALITQGETYVLRPGMPVGVTAKEAKWLCSHPAFYIEKS